MTKLGRPVGGHGQHGHERENVIVRILTRPLGTCPEGVISDAIAASEARQRTLALHRILRDEVGDERVHADPAMRDDTMVATVTPIDSTALGA
jgi:hypothetical protein